MSLLGTLETIGADITKGLAVAGEVIGTFEPAVGTVLADVASVLTQIETASKGKSIPSAATVSTLVQAAAATSLLSQAAPKPAPKPAQSTTSILD